MTTHSDSFVMKIDEVFRFEDGRTIFVGVIESPSTRVGPRTCELLVDGRVIQVLRIEGEMLTEKSAPDEHRSVSTLDELSIDPSAMKEANAELREI